MRKLRATLADTAGNEITVAWPVPEGKLDSHADALGVVTGLYEQLVGGDSPTPVSVETTTTFIETNPRGVS